MGYLVQYSSKGRLGKQMNWQALGTIAEIIGALVVVATVIYLAIQTRQHTLAVQASVRQAMLSEDRELLIKQMDFPFTAFSNVRKKGVI